MIQKRREDLKTKLESKDPAKAKKKKFSNIEKPPNMHKIKEVMKDLVEMSDTTTAAKEVFKNCKKAMEDDQAPNPKIMFVTMLHLANEGNGTLDFINDGGI